VSIPVRKLISMSNNFPDALVMVIIFHRHRNQGLLLSELGGHLMPPSQAPAGTKRLSRLLLSERWSWQVIERFI
jgi:hypothetical protein